jgi:hypothetical protein
MSIVKRWFRPALFVLCVACVLAVPAGAAAIKYQLTISNATVQLGSQTYAGVPVTFTFVGDDTNVVSGTVATGIPTVPTLGYSAIYQGVSSVTIGASGAVLASAVFAPNQVVLSVDHLNGGVGFGFVPGGIGVSGFDVSQLQPIYPGGISNYQGFSGVTQTPPGWMGYDLTLAYAESHTN